MKRIVLERLTLRNFKGIKELVLAANGGDADVYGDNATGKTTMFDGFVWLLFGKDSQNKADFEIKGLDGVGRFFSTSWSTRWRNFLDRWPPSYFPPSIY